MKIACYVEMLNRGKVVWEGHMSNADLKVRSVDSTSVSNFAKIRTTAAKSCIYCGSTESARTREHVIAYALGGTVTIPKRSCQTCQKITHQFETDVLRGPMQMVRYIQGVPSRTKHKDAPEVVSLYVKEKGVE